MDDVWKRVEGLVGRTLHTVKGCPFTIDEVKDNRLYFINSKGRRDDIQKSILIDAYNLNLNPNEITRKRIKEETGSEYSASYIPAILKAIR